MKKKLASLIVCNLVVASAILFVTTSEANIIVIDQSGFGDFTTIQEAIDNASDGDTIYIKNGTYEENIIVNKAITMIGENKSTTTIRSNEEYYTNYTVKIIADNVTMKGFSIIKGSTGIMIESNNNIIEDCIIYDNIIGIHSRTNTNQTIYYNIIFTNEHEGIYLTYSFKNTIEQNIIYGNVHEGIFDWKSAGNKIVNNSFIENGYGLYLYESDNNDIYHNVFMNNTRQACDLGENNTWDNGTHGNWWTDYNGEDINSDGVGDTLIPHPYIDGGEGYYQLDGYPLLNANNSIQLYKGWNLISIPSAQNNTDLKVVLQSINSSYEAVQYYNGKTKQWKHYSKSKPDELNTLGDINYSMGFWIYVNDDVIFEYDEIEVEKEMIYLTEGWNLIGVTQNSQQFPSPESPINKIQHFDAETKQWLTISYGDTLIAGVGYWVHTTSNTWWEW